MAKIQKKINYNKKDKQFLMKKKNLKELKKLKTKVNELLTVYKRDLKEIKKKRIIYDQMVNKIFKKILHKNSKKRS